MGKIFEIESPLPGRIIEILVSKGQEVKKSQPLVILESMKMENEIRSDYDGIIEEIGCEAGSFVPFNHVLFKIREKE